MKVTLNRSKTKMMIENDTPIYVNTTHIENVETYVYQRHLLEETSLQIMRTSSNDTWHINMGPHQPGKEQEGSCTNKD